MEVPMLRKLALRATVALGLTAGLIGGPALAASAAPSAPASAVAPAVDVCGTVRALAAPLLALGLPVNTVVQIVFGLLGGTVQIPEIRACLGL
jgi:hypothetical protein